ncbi:MAG: glycosyltransferase, partial [Actinomycetota bacterium]|nr:glycosyltransferase [Actinomycetota bacterium]
MTRVLVVTNDFPPRPGGIQTFVHELVRRLPADDVVVYTSRWRDWEAFDRAQPFEVVREDTKVLLPTPRVRRRAAEIVRTRGCDAVLFGAAAPLGLLGPDLRKAGAARIVALTHGHEAGWAQLPGARQVLRRIGDGVDTVTYLG